MSTAMESYIELVKQHPGQEQVDLAVEIEVPGSWFGVGSMGSLTSTERREKYNAQAVEYSEVREFPGASRGAGSLVVKSTIHFPRFSHTFFAHFSHTFPTLFGRFAHRWPKRS